MGLAPWGSHGASPMAIARGSIVLANTPPGLAHCTGETLLAEQVKFLEEKNSLQQIIVVFQNRLTDHICYDMQLFIIRFNQPQN